MRADSGFVPLHAHPGAATATAVHALAARVERRADGTLALRYRLQGELARLRTPAPRPPARTDGLWAHTCFELFVAIADGAGYCEYNFSPSRQWAAYAFRGYRERDADPQLDAPPIAVHTHGDVLELDTCVPAPPGLALRLALTAVVEDAAGALSYWALRHPAARPDFHLREGFVLALDATARDARGAT